MAGFLEIFGVIERIPGKNMGENMGKGQKVAFFGIFGGKL